MLSLVIGFVATIIGGTDRQLDASTEASGPHVFAVRFGTVRHRHLHVHRDPPNVVTIMIRPSCRDGMAIICHCSPFGKSEIFFILGLDTISVNQK